VHERLISLWNLRRSADRRVRWGWYLAVTQQHEKIAIC